jgi:hypothetical protein
MWVAHVFKIVDDDGAAVAVLCDPRLRLSSTRPLSVHSLRDLCKTAAQSIEPWFSHQTCETTAKVPAS